MTWAITNKGDEENPDIRARLCTQGLKSRDPYREDVFAPTPPFESLRMLFSLGMTAEEGKTEPDAFMVLDATRAHFHSPATRKVYVKLSDEDYEENKCALLLKSMYGTRDAASNWEDFSAEVAEKHAGLIPGRGSPCLMWNAIKKVRCFKHGDDFVLSGKRENIKAVRDALGKHIKLKEKGVLGLHPELGDVQEVRILNRLVAIKEEDGRATLTIEADPRHAAIITESLGLNGRSKVIGTPGEKVAVVPDLTEVKDSDIIKQFRSLTMRAHYLSEDRYDIKFACKELARDMKSPTQHSLKKLKHLGRFLMERPRQVQKFKWQKYQGHLVTYCDADWAGCTITRKSTTCGVIMHGEHGVRWYSSTQATPSPSSGESEFNSVVKAVASGMGMQAFALDLGAKMDISVGTDSSAAIGMARRTGLGKTRHVATALLWIQAVIKKGTVKLFKEPGTENVADAGTKYLSGPKMEVIMDKMGFEYKEGASQMGFKVQRGDNIDGAGGKTGNHGNKVGNINIDSSAGNKVGNIGNDDDIEKA